MKLSDISEMEKNGDVKGLLESLKDSDPRIRYKAALTLGFIGSKDLNMIHTALKDDNMLIRWGAAYALGGIKNSTSISYLTEALNNETSEPIQKWIIYALGETRDVRAIDSVQEILKKSHKTPDGFMAERWAMHVLGFIGGAESIDLLKKNLKNKFPIHRAQAKWALKKIEYNQKDVSRTFTSLDASKEFKELNMTPAESYLLRLYDYHDKDDIGEFMMLYTLLDLIIRGALTSEVHIHLKEKGGLFRKSKTILEEEIIILPGPELDNMKLKPHELEIVGYTSSEKGRVGIKLSKFRTNIDNDVIGSKFRSDYLQYLADEGYFHIKEGGSIFKGENIELTEKGKNASQLFSDAFNEGQDLRIWIKEDIDMAEEYLNYFRGNNILKRTCFVLDDDVPRLTRQVTEAKTLEENLLCYYYISEGLRSSLTVD